MKLKFDVHTELFLDRLEELSDIMGREVGDLVRGEARLLMAQAMIETPPKGKGLSVKRRQEAQIERGFKKIVSPVRPASDAEDSKYRWHDPKIQKLIKKKNADGLQQVFNAIGGRMSRAIVMPFFDKDAIKQLRGNKKNGPKLYTFDYPAWKRRLKELKDRAGFTKAGWAISYIALGGTRVPAWIRRHIDYARGSIDVSALDGPNPSVTMFAKLGGNSGADFMDGFRSAIIKREQTMFKKAKAILNGHAYDWKNGVVRTFKLKPEPEPDIG